MNDRPPSARSDLLGGAGWVAFGVLIIVESLRMDRFTGMGGTLYTMPGLVPGLLGALLVLLGLSLAWRGWRRRRLHRHGDSVHPQPLLNRRIVVMLAASLVYAIGLVGRAPFAPSTALFVAVFVYVFAPPDAPPLRRGMVAVAAGILTSLAVVLVFERLFFVRLP
ncbi:MAG TPA: tripartite tricarboxylate transporter TctB family protein [Albitalea sp.]